tara:strand:+ start:276 stop:494 length:219 start_codon:yes stop_codon:yes gene_type:complete
MSLINKTATARHPIITTKKRVIWNLLNRVASGLREREGEDGLLMGLPHIYLYSNIANLNAVTITTGNMTYGQ